MGSKSIRNSTLTRKGRFQTGFTCDHCYQARIQDLFFLAGRGTSMESNVLGEGGGGCT